MSSQKVITANEYNHNGATILHAGNHDGNNITNNLTLTDNVAGKGYSSAEVVAVSPASSGNIGTARAVSGNEFNKLRGDVNTYVGTKIDSNLLGPAGDKNRPKHNTLGSGRRYHITAFDIFTGAATKGGSAGALESYGADHEHTTNGEFQILETGKNSTAKDYS